MERKSIKSKEVIPDTHFFVYRNNKYPIKFDYFKYASKYFSKNQIELEGQKNIKLLDSQTENKYAIPDETINDFINFVQQKTIYLSRDNVIDLNFLSNKFEVTNLEEITDEYINVHENDVVLQILRNHKDEIFFDTSKYEKIISSNIKKYINDDLLLTLDIPLLYRIFQIFFIQKSGNDENDEIIEFLFKCLDKYGRNASVLFDGAEFGKRRKEHLSRLIRDYSDIFDIHYIKKTIVDVLVEYENEMKKQNENFECEISIKNSEILKLKNEEEMIKEQNENLQREINIQKQYYSKKIDELEKVISIKNAELEKMKVENKKKDIESRSLREKNNKLVSELEMNKNEFKTKNENQKNIFMKQIEDLKNQLQQQEKQLNYKVKLQNKKSIPILYNPNIKFNGIIKYLIDKTKGNIHDNGTIEVTTNSYYNNNKSTEYHPKNLLDYCHNSFFWAYQDNNVWICFDFKEKKIKITNYTIKSDSDPPNFRQLKSWRIEISNDGIKWDKIDERNECTLLNGPNFMRTFDTVSNDFTRYVRLLQTGYLWNRGNHLRLAAIEFYGYLEE